MLRNANKCHIVCHQFLRYFIPEQQWIVLKASFGGFLGLNFLSEFLKKVLYLFMDWFVNKLATKDVCWWSCSCRTCAWVQKSHKFLSFLPRHFSTVPNRGRKGECLNLSPFIRSRFYIPKFDKKSKFFEKCFVNKVLALANVISLYSYEFPRKFECLVVELSIFTKANKLKVCF